MRKLVLLAVALAGCTQLNSQVVDPLIVAVQKINATAQGDLVVAQNVANAATPRDADGFNCAAAALAVDAQVNAVLAAANVPTAGPLATAELASLFQPGSIQYNQAKQALVSGCAAKAQDVLGPAGLIAAGGVTGAIAAGKVLPMLAMVP